MDEGTSGFKIFDKHSADERLHLEEGISMEQNEFDCSFTSHSNMFSVVGRLNDLHHLLRQIKSPAYSCISVTGKLGIGKTQLINEMHRYLHRRGSKEEDSMHIFDFSQVREQEDIIQLFQQQGLEHLLKVDNPFAKRSTVSSIKGIAKASSKTILVYDNIEEFIRNRSLFHWHIRQMIERKKNIKIITLS